MSSNDFRNYVHSATATVPEKIHNNMFAIFQIVASFLPDVVYFGKRM